MKKLAIWLSISVTIMVPGFPSYCQSLPITFIEVFGNRQISANAVIQKAGIHEGDTVEISGLDGKQIIDRIKTLSTIKRSTVEVVCCEGRTGGWLFFIGIAESDSFYYKYHKNPEGSVTLTKEMIQTYDDFMGALQKAIVGGNITEDHSNGYSLMNDSASRILQMKFIGYANDNLELLQKVIHESSDPEQRAIAAWIIAYNDNKNKFIPDLLYAVSDSNEVVRNNATRSLSILAGYAPTHPSLNIEIPAQPFIDMIHSIVWTDRNKGSAVLEGISRGRNKELLSTLKKSSFAELLEMAKWRSSGHAYFAFKILGRMAGMEEVEVDRLFENHIKNVDLLVQKINR